MALWPSNQTTTAFCIIVLIDGLSYSAVNHWRQIVSSRRCPSVEWSAAARHVSAVSWHYSVSPEDLPVHSLLWCLMIVQCLCSDTSHFRHYNRFCYLLTYLCLFLDFLVVMSRVFTLIIASCCCLGDRKRILPVVCKNELLRDPLWPGVISKSWPVKPDVV